MAKLLQRLRHLRPFPRYNRFFNRKDRKARKDKPSLLLSVSLLCELGALCG